MCTGQALAPAGQCKSRKQDERKPGESNNAGRWTANNAEQADRD